MLSKSSKSWVIALISLLILGALVFLLSKSAATPETEQSAINPPPAMEQTAASTTIAPAVEAIAPAAGGAQQSLLSAPQALTIDLAAAMSDRVIGSSSAPVTIVEYASLTCSHCAHFAADILPEVKKQLLDTGKAKLIFRDFPLDSLALKASMMARCAPADKYFNLIEVILSSHDRWLSNSNPLEGLAQLGALAGVDTDLFNACMQNKALETAILARMQEAQSKHEIKSTPAFVFNDGAQVLGGAQDVGQFVEIVNKLTQGK